MLLRDVLAEVYARLAERVPRPVVLDVGSGRGDNLGILLQVFSGAHLVALDVDLQSVSTLREKFKREWGQGVLSIVAGDAENLPFRGGAFGIIASLAVLHHLDSVGKALNEVERALSHGGVVVVVEWTPESRLNPHDPETLRRALREVREVIPKLFRIVDLRVYRDYYVVSAEKQSSQSVSTGSQLKEL